jgi:isopenicillin N synthase-like dioxygenase
VRPADYDATDSERTPDGVKELKESFEIGRENHKVFKNHWPENEGEVAGFRAGMMSFWEQCTSLHMQMMRAIAMGLGLEEKYFDGFVDVGDNNLRLLHYPAVKANVFKAKTGQVRAGEHAVSWTSKIHTNVSHTWWAKGFSFRIMAPSRYYSKTTEADYR